MDTSSPSGHAPDSDVWGPYVLDPLGVYVSRGCVEIVDSRDEGFEDGAPGEFFDVLPHKGVDIYDLVQTPGLTIWVVSELYEHGGPFVWVLFRGNEQGYALATWQPEFSYWTDPKLLPRSIMKGAA